MSEESKKKRDTREVIEHQIGDYPENWIDDNISPYDIEPYIFPNEEILNKNNIHSHYFSYYFKWSVNDNYRYVQKKLPDFRENEMGRTEGTFTNFDSLDDKIDDLHIVAKGLIEYETLSLEEVKDLIKGIQPSREDFDNESNDEKSNLAPSVPKTSSKISPQPQ